MTKLGFGGPIRSALLATLCLAASPAGAGALALRCWAQPVVFLDGEEFPAIHETVHVDRSHGWRMNYEQFWRRLPDGLTFVIDRDTGRLEKYDLLGHVQLGRCLTLRYPRGWSPLSPDL